MSPKAIAYILGLLEEQEKALNALFGEYIKNHSDAEAEKYYQETIWPKLTYIQQFRAMDWRTK